MIKFSAGQARPKASRAIVFCPSGKAATYSAIAGIPATTASNVFSPLKIRRHRDARALLHSQKFTSMGYALTIRIV